ncbi:IspD/TarI family cytidylyltransferase [Marinicella meishanensis]|uniref:IspD/TarI family cytidylyltransferase n=1 Tax=Marinicella meishanensis TaxID=2873263 RepID=UPI001CBE5BF7|nr:2-C-methyl-D-erythritol 4-phosphate cytidylyltransferase [Marinicella sp. NBU2979]
MTTERIHIIIVAAGTGARFRHSQPDSSFVALPKQYEMIGQQSVLAHSIQAFDAVATDAAEFVGITVVLHPADRHWQDLPPVASPHPIQTTPGGSQRHDSVRNGIRAIQLQHPNWAQDWVLVHDAARPCVTAAEINDLVATCLAQGQGGLLVKPVIDTIKHSCDGHTVDHTVDRRHLYAALTPQLFNGADLLKALTVFEADSITDESSALEAQGKAPLMVVGKNTNIKITQYDDLLLAQHILTTQGRL